MKTQTIKELRDRGFYLRATDEQHEAYCCTVLASDKPFWLLNSHTASPDDPVSQLRKSSPIALLGLQEGSDPKHLQYGALVSGNRDDHDRFPFFVLDEEDVQAWNAAWAAYEAANHAALQARESLKSKFDSLLGER